MTLIIMLIESLTSTR